jgi:NAD(P)H-hydrate epimerase
MAALRSGAGLVELLVPETVAMVAATFDPCVMTRGLVTSPEGTLGRAAVDVIIPKLDAAAALAIGPGMGRSPDVIAIIARLWAEAAIPAVFDADALWALGHVPTCDRARCGGPRVVTPHAGEMLRLVGHDPSGPGARDRGILSRIARDFASETGAVVVLKGAGTLVVGDAREAVNETGNPGMATAGTGDVLTGVVAALLAQGMDVFDAVRLGVWVHGVAGDAAAADRGQVSMTARDLLDRLHVGFRLGETARAP